MKHIAEKDRKETWLNPHNDLTLVLRWIAILGIVAPLTFALLNQPAAPTFAFLWGSLLLICIVKAVMDVVFKRGSD